jgi:hypothetical protein
MLRRAAASNHPTETASTRDRGVVGSGVAAAWVYLDQKDWIALARVRAGKPCADALSEAAGALAFGVSVGAVVTPFSESHVLEKGGISDPTKRQDVATTIVGLSGRHALAPLHLLWAQEADAFLRLHFGAHVDGEPEPFGKGLPFALGFTDDDVEAPWPADVPEADIAMAEMLAIAEPSRIVLSPKDIERRTRWEKWAKFMTSASQSLIQDREKYNEQDRLAAATLAMLHPALLHRAIGLDVHESFLDFLREEGPWAVVREMPTLAFLTELHRARYPDAHSPWTTNDYHDIHFLCVALAYCSAVCPDHRWGGLARRSEYIASLASSSPQGEMRSRRPQIRCRHSPPGARARPRRCDAMARASLLFAEAHARRAQSRVRQPTVGDRRRTGFGEAHFGR